MDVGAPARPRSAPVQADRASRRNDQSQQVRLGGALAAPDARPHRNVPRHGYASAFSSAGSAASTTTVSPAPLSVVGTSSSAAPVAGGPSDSDEAGDVGEGEGSAGTAATGATTGRGPRRSSANCVPL